LCQKQLFAIDTPSIPRKYCSNKKKY